MFGCVMRKVMKFGANLLNHVMPLVSFDTPENIRKPKVFLCFSGDIKRDQWHEMG